MTCGIEGDTQAHHLMRPWRGIRGMAQRAGDDNVIPLCGTCHAKLHSMGSEEKFFLKTMGRRDHGQFFARLIWLNSPHYERSKRDK